MNKRRGLKNILVSFLIVFFNCNNINIKTTNEDLLLYLNHQYKGIILNEFYIKVLNISDYPIKVVQIDNILFCKDSTNYSKNGFDTLYIAPKKYKFLIINGYSILSLNKKDSIFTPCEIKLKYIINDTLIKINNFKVKISKCYNIIPESKKLETKLKFCNDTIDKLPVWNYKYDNSLKL